MTKDEAPEKLYVDIHDNINDSFLYGFTEKRTDEDIEYSCTDVFIDKVLEWLCNNYDKYIRVTGSSIYPAYPDLYRDFQNYMKGE